MNRRAFLKTIAGTAVLSGLWSISPPEAFPAAGKKTSVLIVAHMDDEVIFFLPWLNEIKKIIIAALPLTRSHLEILQNYPAWYRALWIPARGITTHQDYYDKWLDYDARRELITEDCLALQLRDIVADPDITEIYTHSPWGEYGHAHHRMVSRVVRRLASGHGKDVWCPNMVIRFPPEGRPHSTYETAYLPAFTQKKGLYYSHIFQRIRQLYLDETEKAISRGWYSDYPINFWSWGKGYSDFPQGYQKYFLAVDKGHDLTLGCPEIRQLIADVPVYGE